ncbi:MAG: 16S rRNA (cytidine(1402)-2'-O)-methyltransferase [Deltaproteobacteria bacterium]|nr:16S rRNA (cytidine(1402)-2'-O)-methyltransferase [Deltaproteobacteria bacterium]
MTGTLFIVATPIGNLEDITLRAIRTLKEVDLIACEDTRHSQKLLNHYGISKPLTSYFEHNKLVKGEMLIHQLLDGKNIALISDAGTPGISDPGYNLVVAAIEKGISVVPIPGSSAVMTALSVAGLPTDQFHFVGFLPQKEGKKKKLLESLREESATVVFYESPFRITKTVRLLYQIFGDRFAVLVHELTKIHEKVFRGGLSSLEDQIKLIPAKGEWVVLLHGLSEE